MRWVTPGVSSITTRPNNQFPWLDLYRLDKQPYSLQTKAPKKSFSYFAFFAVRFILTFVLFAAFVVNNPRATFRVIAFLASD